MRLSNFETLNKITSGKANMRRLEYSQKAHLKCYQMVILFAIKFIICYFKRVENRVPKLSKMIVQALRILPSSQEKQLLQKSCKNSCKQYIFCKILVKNTSCKILATILQHFLISCKNFSRVVFLAKNAIFVRKSCMIL